MSSGLTLGIVLVLAFTVWAAADFIVWISGGESLSMWLIKKSKAKKKNGWLILIFIVLFSTWLIVHLELLSILLN